jgi:hypothetical protein
MEFTFMEISTVGKTSTPALGKMWMLLTFIKNPSRLLFTKHKAALGQVFSEYFGLPCQAFHQMLHTHHPGLEQ